MVGAPTRRTNQLGQGEMTANVSPCSCATSTKTSFPCGERVKGLRSMAKLLEQVRTHLYSANADEQVEAARQLCDQHEWDALPELLRLLAQDECGYSVAQALRAFGPEVC